MQKTIIAVIVTAIIVGGGVYFWQQQKSEVATVSVVDTQDKQNVPAAKPTNTVKSAPTPSPEPARTQPPKESPQFDSMDKYVSLVLNPATGNQYKATKPAGFERAKFGGQGEGINVAPDGVSASVFVVAKNSWDVGNMNDISTFYLEVVSPSPCWAQENCNEPETVTYYGPFQGKLKLLVQ